MSPRPAVKQQLMASMVDAVHDLVAPGQAAVPREVSRASESSARASDGSGPSGRRPARAKPVDYSDFYKPDVEEPELPTDRKRSRQVVATFATSATSHVGLAGATQKAPVGHPRLRLFLFCPMPHGLHAFASIARICTVEHMQASLETLHPIFAAFQYAYLKSRMSVQQRN